MFKKSYQISISIIIIIICSISIVQVDANAGEIKATILKVGDNSPIVGQLFYLIPVKYENGDLIATINFDHPSTSDQEGHINFKNIEPGQYEIFCNMCDPFKNKNGSILVIEIKEENTRINLGNLFMKIQ